VHHAKAEFGHFAEAKYSARALRQALGAPSRIDPTYYDGYSNCTLSWRELGVMVNLTDYGQPMDVCEEGYFTGARLTDPRWHTASGVHPGGKRSTARHASLRRCRRRGPAPCSVSGYALELHRTDCASIRVPGVIAHVRGARVVSLVILTRGCE
jgi:hypothetical protein